MGNYNFQKDLERAKECEKKVVEMLQSHPINTDFEFNNDAKYDIKYKCEGNEITLEVKEDLMWEKTGNVAIELQSRGKPSGICTSVADRWCYVLGDEFWFGKPGDIRLFLIQHWDRIRRVKGGDDGTSFMALVKLEDFKEIFTRIPKI